MKKIFKILIFVGLAWLILHLLSLRPIPARITYGVSFSKFHADELGLDWKRVYLAILDDLKVRNLRLTAHWTMVEPEKGRYNFTELDYQMAEARKRGASVILAVGRRLPGWPECHVPDWARQGDSGYDHDALLKYIETAVNRYKSYSDIKYWQVENEPYLGFFSRSACGELDEPFLQKEIDLVHRLDPSRKILLTSSGEFDSWFSTYKHSDVFGSSVYLYVWWKAGPVRYPITPAFFRLKQNLVQWLYGDKPKVLIELAAEPWLRMPIVGTPNKTLLMRMGIDKLNEMIDFARQTGFDTQYLWGAEWWYYMREKQNHPEFWRRAQELFAR